MKFKNILYYLAIIILLTSKLWATNTNPVVANVAFDISGTTVTVHYDVTDAEQGSVTINMKVSTDNGVTWAYNFGTATGDIGPNIPVGTAKTITWTYTDAFNPNIKIMIAANDEQVGGSDCGLVNYGGKIYSTILIGTQCWLNENLDVGTQISGSVYQTDNGIIEKYCYNDDPANCAAYGGLYQWDETMQYVTTTGTKGICPTGWHIPTNADFSTLESLVGGDGNSLKSIGQGFYNGVSTNTSGFSAFLAGGHFGSPTNGGYFTGSGSYVAFQSSSLENNTLNSDFIYLQDYTSNISLSYDPREFGFSVRCVQGAPPSSSVNVNLTMGNPSGATTDINNPHNYLLDKPQFCASYDRDRGIPNWTSWQLNSAWCNGPAGRKDNYIPDPTLPSDWYHVGGNDYNYSTTGFQRGHMCPSADRLNTQENNDALFVMTNLIPQSGPNNNGVWNNLEMYERTLANAGNVLYIICGGYGAGGTTDKGYFTTITDGKVTVPAKTWKVIMVLPAGTNDVLRVTTSTRTIAVIMNNDIGPFNGWGTYRVSVDYIESLTGYDFFSNVPASIQAVIEANVDTGPTN